MTTDVKSIGDFKGVKQMSKIVCVDFDGTVVFHEYPEVGADVPHATTVLKHMQDRDYRIILWTMRSGEHLQDAVNWFSEKGIELFGVNNNPEQSEWTASPKAYAQIYIDDAALGCPILPAFAGGRPFVDWRKVEKMLFDEMESEK